MKIFDGSPFEIKDSNGVSRQVTADAVKVWESLVWPVDAVTHFAAIGPHTDTRTCERAENPGTGLQLSVKLVVDIVLMHAMGDGILCMDYILIREVFCFFQVLSSIRPDSKCADVCILLCAGSCNCHRHPWHLLEASSSFRHRLYSVWVS